MLTKPKLQAFSHSILRMGSSFIAVGGCLMEGGEKDLELKKKAHQMTDDEALEEFRQIINRAVEVRKKTSLGPGLGEKYPHMPNAELCRRIMPSLYFEAVSGKKIPQVVAMELPMQAFGLQGLLPADPAVFFTNLSELYGYCDSLPREGFPTKEEYLDYKRDELCLRLKDILEGYRRGDIIFEEVMIDIVNESSLSKLFEVTQNANWRVPDSRKRFQDCIYALHTALEESFTTRGPIHFFFYDRPPQYSRRALYINRLRQLLRQIQEN